jgi:two-component system NarL family sensor kinase
MKRRMAARLAWGVWGLSLAFAALTWLLLWLNRSDASFSGRLFEVVLTVLFATPGAVIVAHRPANPIGWMFCAIGLTQGVNGFGNEYGIYALLTKPGSLPGGVAALQATSVWVVLWGLAPLLFLLFPDGSLPSRRWRPVVWVVAGVIVVLVVSQLLAPGPIGNEPGYPPNPLGIRGAFRVLELSFGGGTLVLLAAALASLVALIGRFRRAAGQERQQLRWFACAAVVLAASLTLLFTPWDSYWIGLGGVGVFTTAVAVAIVRHHLYDIDLLINRTLVYGLLTALVVGLYVATVSLLGVALRQRAGLVASLVATGVVAVLFQPIRERLQRAVNRLLYGERQDPYRVLAGLGQRLEATVAPQAVLPGVVETIAQALRLPYVAIELGRGDELEPVAVWGQTVGEPLAVPLVYRAEPIGRLLLGPRARGEPFSPADRRLLADLAGPVAMAASAVALTGDLQRSRQRLVTALEEERRRLRRDLHDGLGPALAGVTLEIGAARNLLGRDPAAADALLARLQAETKAATAEIRRVAYGLRPPALDELGLVGAIREEAGRFAIAEHASVSGRAGLVVLVEAPEDLDRLSAAVEVAAYRIALEALTNVARHANASRCTIQFICNDGLELAVTDGGTGLPADYRAGVGLTSLRERAAELGGACTIESVAASGTRVRAHLPIWTA